MKPYMDDAAELSVEIGRQNFDLIKRKEWYENLILFKKPSNKMIDFYLSSEYKNLVLEYATINLGSLRSSLEQFDVMGMNVYHKIFTFLGKSNLLQEDSIKFQYDPLDFSFLTGVYKPVYYSNEYFQTLEDSIVISAEKEKLYYTPFFKDGSDSRRELIPVSKYYFRTVRGLGYYHINYIMDDNVESIRFSSGTYYSASVKIK